LLRRKLLAAEKKLEGAADYILDAVEAPSMASDSHSFPVEGARSSTEDTNLYNKHIAMLSEWDRDSFALKAMASVRREGGEGGDDDDDAKEPLPGSDLLDQFIRSHAVIQRQRRRINSVTTKEHLLQLVDHQRSLSDAAAEYTAKCQSDAKELAALDAEYEELRARRIGLQQKIKAMVRECNDVISRENEVAEARAGLAAKKRQNERDREKVSVSSTQCLSVIKSYDEFIENNEKYIEGITRIFDGLWASFESKWTLWNPDDIASWMRYKTVALGTATKFDWDRTRGELERRNITGKSLRKFSELTFECLEIRDFEAIQHLMAAIHSLKNKVDAHCDPKPKEIPPDFLCPLTNKVMVDPVMAFDGRNYERKRIEEYLKKHNKSPVTGKDADFAIVFPNHRLRGEIRCFMANHGSGFPSISDLLSENSTDEGVPDTAPETPPNL